MAILTLTQANGWADGQKLVLSSIDSELEAQIVSQVFGAVSEKYSTVTWLSATSTPKLIVSIISMMYVGYLFHRTYSTDSDPGLYGTLLIDKAETLLKGVVDGNVALLDPYTGAVLTNSVGQTASIAPELLSTEPKFTMAQEW